jgi:hypothetical protein
MTITYTTAETYLRGINYSAHVSLAGRHVILGHFLLDNFAGEVATLKRYVAVNAVAILKAYHYTDEEIASAD